MTELRRALGPERLKALSDRLGGTSLRIPATLKAGRPPERFADRVGGEQIALILILHCADLVVYIPRLSRTPGKAITVKSVMRLTERNMSARAIALRLGCSERLVRKRRAEYKHKMTAKT